MLFLHHACETLSAEFDLCLTPAVSLVGLKFRSIKNTAAQTRRQSECEYVAGKLIYTVCAYGNGFATMNLSLATCMLYIKMDGKQWSH